MTDIGIELHVPAFGEALEFYGWLGFEVVRQDERYLVMRRGESVLCFNEGSERVYEQSYFKKFPQDTPPGYAVEIILPVDDVETFYNSVKDQVRVVQLLEEKHWGQKDFRIVDPFGFYIRVTERYDWVSNRPVP